MNALISNVFNQYYFISQEGSDANLPLIIRLLKGNFQNIDFSANREINRMYFLSGDTFNVSDYGQTMPPEKAPENSVAVIPVFGVITKADQECGPSGTDTKKALLFRCGTNPNITGVILDISSPGGEAFASLDFYKAILDFKTKYNKQVVAYIQDAGCSGAQYIAAACDKIICSDELTQVGSIGVITHIIDQIKTLENEGIIAKEIYAAESSEKNIEVREALNGNNKPLLERASTLVNRFVTDVKACRPNISTSGIDPFKGRTLFAKEAIQIGLIDQIGSIQIAVQHINNSKLNNSQTTNSSMKISFKTGWAALAAIFSSKKEGDELTEADIDTMNSELINRQTSIDRLTSDLAAANLARTNAEDSQKQAEDALKLADASVKAVEGQFANATTLLDALDDSVKNADSVADKVTAISVLLAAKPGVAAIGAQSKKDVTINADGVDWETMNALPHMQ
ncbi:MAG: S49 family peptidase [Bacteroidales bacterium]